MSKKIRVEILDEGDDVIGFSDNRIAVKKANGDLEIFTLHIEDGAVPTIDERIIVITKKTSRGKKVSIKSNDGSFEVGSF